MLRKGDPYSRLFVEPAVEVSGRDDGAVFVSSPHPLKEYPDKIGVFLHRWAQRTPDEVFLAQRDADGTWRRLTYGEALNQVERVAQSLLDGGLGHHRPVMILSGNSIETGVLMLAAMHVGVPVAPVSPAYSLMSRDFEKLRYLRDLVRPGLVYAAGEEFVPALDVVRGPSVPVVTRDGANGDLAFVDLLRTEPTDAVETAYDAVDADTVAKILFTSGSTGMPKGVINTQRMQCSNQQALAQIWPVLEEEKPVIVDWLPWHHTFGSNHNFNMVLRNGGTLYIDAGKPLPSHVEITVNNLREVSPTMYFNVPGGYQALLPYLEKDEELRDRFFGRLRFIFYAAASLPQSVWERLEALSEASLGYKVPMISSWGATETAPLVTNTHYRIERAGIIGVPVPGSELKLVPTDHKVEIRVRGPNVTPGYWKAADKTREAFDEEGFYKAGDAVRFADPDAPEKGLLFDGRIAENFKLTSGTWVDVGSIRLKAIEACAPAVQDAVVAGHDRDEIGLLIFPSTEGCRKLAQANGDGGEEPASARAVTDHLRSQLAEHNRSNPGGSTRIRRVLVMREPPSMDAGEITDKGYINQAKVLERRADLVQRLYGEEGDEVVLIE